MVRPSRMVGWRMAVALLAGLFGVLVPTTAAGALPSSTSATDLGWRAVWMSYECDGVTQPLRVRVRFRAPRIVPQNSVFTMEGVSFGFVAPIGLNGRITGTLRPPEGFGGWDLQSWGPPDGVTPGDFNETFPVSGTFTSTVPVGTEVSFRPGPMTVFVAAGGRETPIRCQPQNPNTILHFLYVSDPVPGTVLRDEFSVRALRADGSVAYQQHGFLASGNWLVSRSASGFVSRLVGGGTFAVGSQSGSVVLWSTTAPSPATVLGVNDPSAGVELRAGSTRPHGSQAGEETIAGFAPGTLNGQPVGVYWFVRDLVP
jgi:hypothetical protein